MRKFLVCLCIFIVLPCYGQDVKVIRTNESFQETAHIDVLQEIRVNTVPRTTYTPQNLRTQYNMRFTGRNTETGAMTVWSTPINDYDTKIMGTTIEDDKYYIYDNTGKSFLTGERVNLAPLNDRMDRFNQDLQGLDNRIDSLESNTRAGLATVTALTSLHPNPRAEEMVEVSLGTGVYRDQCAGAAGVFIHPSKYVMIQGGAAFGNRENWAGFAGMTFSIGRVKLKE